VQPLPSLVGGVGVCRWLDSVHKVLAVAVEALVEVVGSTWVTSVCVHTLVGPKLAESAEGDHHVGGDAFGWSLVTLDFSSKSVGFLLKKCWFFSEVLEIFRILPPYKMNAVSSGFPCV
jgi:hypothetical protein